MKTLHSAVEREVCARRVTKLTPVTVPLWGKMSAPEMAAWDTEVGDFVAMREHFGQRDAVAPWPSPPVFGKMSRTDWGVLAYRQTDHHLRQFNV